MKIHIDVSVILKSNGKPDIRKSLDMYNNCEQYVVLHSVMLKNIYYAAIKSKLTGRVYGYVAKTIEYDKNGYKLAFAGQFECSNPEDTKCPESILGLLTPTDNIMSNYWRGRCREYHAGLAFKRLPMGTKISWTIPCDFLHSRRGDKLEMVKARAGKVNKWIVKHPPGGAFPPEYIHPTDYVIIQDWSEPVYKYQVNVVDDEEIPEF